MQHQKTLQDLRKFGLIMFAILALIGCLLIWRGRSFGYVLGSISILFFVPAMFFPAKLALAEKLWLAFGEKLSIVVSFVVLVLTFVAVFVPMGLAMRVMRKDPLQRKFDRQAKTYWVPVDPNGPSSRYFTPY